MKNINRIHNTKSSQEKSDNQNTNQNDYAQADASAQDANAHPPDLLNAELETEELILTAADIPGFDDAAKSVLISCTRKTGIPDLRTQYILAL